MTKNMIEKLNSIKDIQFSIMSNKDNCNIEHNKQTIEMIDMLIEGSDMNRIHTRISNRIQREVDDRIMNILLTLRHRQPSKLNYSDILSFYKRIYNCSFEEAKCRIASRLALIQSDILKECEGEEE